MNPPVSCPDLERIGRQALPQVLESLFGWSATELPPADRALGEASGQPLLATVQLTGPRASGVVQVKLPSVFATQAATHLVGGDHAHSAGATSAADLAGEFCNMLAGRVAAQLGVQGYPCELGIPEVVEEPAVGGARLLPSHPQVQRTTARQPPRPAHHSRTDWSCQGHQLTLEIRLRCVPA